MRDIFVTSYRESADRERWVKYEKPDMMEEVGTERRRAESYNSGNHSIHQAYKADREGLQILVGRE